MCYIYKSTTKKSRYLSISSCTSCILSDPHYQSCPSTTATVTAPIYDDLTTFMTYASAAEVRLLLQQSSIPYVCIYIYIMQKKPICMYALTSTNINVNERVAFFLLFFFLYKLCPIIISASIPLSSLYYYNIMSIGKNYIHKTNHIIYTILYESNRLTVQQRTSNIICKIPK